MDHHHTTTVPPPSNRAVEIQGRGTGWPVVLTYGLSIARARVAQEHVDFSD